MIHIVEFLADRSETNASVLSIFCFGIMLGAGYGWYSLVPLAVGAAVNYFSIEYKN